MAEKTISVTQQQTKPIKILKWKVSEGNTVAVGRIILLYDFEGAPSVEQRKLKVTQAGTVYKILAQTGTIVKPGQTLCELKECTHPTVMNDMCAECGTDLRKNEVVISASVPMVHAIPDLKVSEEQAQKLGKADSERLLRDRKLVLLVDLDQTLIHTTNDHIQPNIKDVYHFQLYGPNSPWFFTRLRPRTHEFLNNIHPFFELHICTFGARNYAHMIAKFLDIDQKFFSSRILSRDECFDPTSKKANLKALFPCGDNLVCIIDDREDVWSNALNLIHVKPYHFFQHTGDINAPPGLDKHENDNKSGVDLTKLKQISKKEDDISLKQDKNETPKEETNGETADRRPNGVKINKCEENPADCDENQVDNEENQVAIDEKHVVTEETQVACEENRMDSEEKQGEDQKIHLSNDIKQDKGEQGQEKSGENECISEEKENKAEEAQVPSDNTQDTSKEKNLDEQENNCHDAILGQVQPDQECLIEIEDPDDYLMYLEDILKRIHHSFYEDYDKMESGDVPDLKKVIPTVRGRILKDCKLVFSGLVPTHIKLEQSKAYQIARSLGAHVTKNFEDDTTHLVAVIPGTAKVHLGRRRKNLKIVTPDWLWSCAERWEHVNEKVFALNSKGSKNRHPPPHCSSPEHVTNYPEHNTPAARKRTPSGRFMDTINPLMSFSSADIADMDKEVEDILDDDTGSSEEDKPKAVVNEVSTATSSSSSEDSLSGEFPKGYKRLRENDKDNNKRSADEDELPSVKMRRGEALDNDFEGVEDSDRSLDPPDEMDDGEWNMMGAALEREFLSNN